VGDRPASTYREVPAPPALAPFVECLWAHVVGEGSEPYEQPVLPDGCVDIVAVGDDVGLAGPATGTTTLRLLPGTLTVGVRFRTGAAPALVGASAVDLRDRHLPLDELWGREGAALTGRIVDAAGWEGRLAAMVDGVAARLGSARPPDPVGLDIARLLAERSRWRMTAVAEDLGLSERQLRRRVEDAVGYPPRTLARILRFQRFLRAARRAGAGRHLAVLAADAGYADQAHLTRESRGLSGLPPAALLDWEVDRLAAG
jgi:AraC-like DNA-binding protein